MARRSDDAEPAGTVALRIAPVPERAPVGR